MTEREPVQLHVIDSDETMTELAALGDLTWQAHRPPRRSGAGFRPW